MKTAEHWFPVLNGLPNTDEAGEDAKFDFLKTIRAIQADAERSGYERGLREAAEIAKETESENCCKIAPWPSEAILAKLKQP